jgi:hypothetical protein
LGENGGNSKFVIIIGFSGQMVGGKTRMEKNKKSSTATLEDCLNWMGEQLKNSQNAALSFDFRG